MCYCQAECGAPHFLVSLSSHSLQHHKCICHQSILQTNNITHHPAMDKCTPPFKTPTIEIKKHDSLFFTNECLLFCDCGYSRKANVCGVHRNHPWALLVACTSECCTNTWFACASCERARAKMKGIKSFQDHARRYHSSSSAGKRKKICIKRMTTSQTRVVHES